MFDRTIRLDPRPAAPQSRAIYRMRDGHRREYDPARARRRHPARALRRQAEVPPSTTRPGSSLSLRGDRRLPVARVRHAVADAVLVEDVGGFVGGVAELAADSRLPHT